MAASRSPTHVRTTSTAVTVTGRRLARSTLAYHPNTSTAGSPTSVGSAECSHHTQKRCGSSESSQGTASSAASVANA